MNIKLVLIALWVFMASGCALTPEKHRDARLMPQEVAKEIIAKHTSKSWSEHPQALAGLASHPLCDDTELHDLDYSHMKVVWNSMQSIVEIHSDKKEVGFFCGTYLIRQIKYTSLEDRDDIIDALVSLGAKTLVR